MAVESWVLNNNCRKIYCTATINNKGVISYLLKSSYVIEAQLKSQYGMFDELVFGKILKNDNRAIKYRKLPTSKVKADISELSNNQDLLPKLVDFMKEEFSEDIVKISKKVAESFLKDSLREDSSISYEKKPKYTLISHKDGKIFGCAILLPKRGGAIKAVLSFGFENVGELQRLIKKCEKFAKDKKRHKLYFTIPDDRFDYIEALKRLGYETEGILRKPYKKNKNIIVSSKTF